MNPYRITATLRSNEAACPDPEGVARELELSLRESYSQALADGRMTLEVTFDVFGTADLYPGVGR